MKRPHKELIRRGELEQWLSDAGIGWRRRRYLLLTGRIQRFYLHRNGRAYYVRSQVDQVITAEVGRG